MPSAKTLREKPAVSVIVATRNRPEDLKRCIQSILKIEGPCFELIVVDQSLPDTSALDGVEDSRLRVLRRETPGKSAAMNVAVQAAQGEILAFTDDDCTVEQDWLQKAWATMNKAPCAAVVFGRVDAAPCDDEDMFTPKFSPLRYRRLHGRFAQRDASGMGANMIVRRSVLLEIGGFESAIGPGSTLRSGDDWEFAFRALKAGYDVVQDPGVSVLHWGARSIAKGEVRRLLFNNYFGVGGGLALHLRRGDLAAGGLFIRQVWMNTAWVIANLLHRRQSGARRLLALFSGFKAGWQYQP